ncbi:MAG TPA: hypothetical protein PK156_14945 [Polyangium sp.]|nr:hypothetical protein [Polyangium sp.]
MKRLMLGMVAGVVAGGLTTGIVETIVHNYIFKPPPGFDASNPEALRLIMDEIPLGAKVGVIVAWGMGVLVGGTLAAFLARRGPMTAWWVGAILFGMAGMTMLSIPHPAWMWVAAILTTIIAAFAAGRIGGRQAGEAPKPSTP